LPTILQKEYLILGIIDKIQINATVKYHFIPNRMAQIKIPATPDDR
jgi:hypothetical protein